MYRLMGVCVSIFLPLGFGTFQAASAESFTLEVQGDQYSASAVFSLAGNVLDITLSNTYSDGADFAFKDTDVLTALFFDVAMNPTLVPVSAKTPTGSVIRKNGVDITASETSGEPLGHGDVGDAWAYTSGSLAGVAQKYGIGAAGLNIFGPPDLFHPKGKLPSQQGTAPNGVDYGLMPRDTTNYSHAKLSESALIQSGITVELAGFTGSLDDIHNVRFQYGTSMEAFSVVVVPEPSIAILAGTMAFALSLWLSRSRKKGDRRIYWADNAG